MAPAVFVLRQIRIERICYVEFENGKPNSEARCGEGGAAVNDVAAGGARGVDPLHVVQARRVRR